MTISEMTDAELDRMIAEKRGWKYLETPFGNGWETPHDAKGYYTIKNRIPRFTTDPRYAMELLKEFPNPQITKYTDFWRVVPDIDADMEHYIISDNIELERAIAEAWMGGKK